MNLIDKKNSKENTPFLEILRKKVNGEFIFTLFLFILILIFFFETFGYPFEGKMIPFIVLSPNLFILLTILIGDFYPKVSRWIKSKGRINELTKEVEKKNKSELMKEKEEINEKILNEEKDLAIKPNIRDEIIKPIGAMIVLLLLIFLLGVLPAVICFSFLFIKFYAKRGIILSLIITSGIWLFIYILFIRLLHVRFPMGILKLPFLS